ncbi:U-box domain-containing family protein [Striga asiatica]|uniref:RING-type E3 ubiquitin transferase n=1 Tax=Striga asiatica TaxID=4170 RepID=A0A5A7RGU4_STRAF|nr:U-box domain-containing family protein [Striga asiatica]
MDSSEVEDNLLSISEPKLHGDMCKSLYDVYVKVLGIFPDLEASRPRSTSGIQALCALHIALEKTKNILQHCADCSKLYLAITGDSVVLKFEKARCALEDGLRRVEDIVPQAIGVQIAEILVELGCIEFTLNPTEKQIGDEIITLLQQGSNFSTGSNDNNELESFHQAASKLGITSSRAALRERRALKKLVDRAQTEEDKRKESIVAYLLHLIKKYSKLFRSEISDDNDSQGSTPCSPTLQGNASCPFFDRQLSKLSSFNFKPNLRRSGQMPVPPEELRCPISLQLMYDPVIIASGQTYERVCIEKWFDDGHQTCPKTQQQLPHLSLTSNYCVKGLVGGWCEQNGVPVPEGPPESLDLNYWRLVLSESYSADSKSLEYKGVPLNNIKVEEEEEDETCEARVFEKYKGFLRVLEDEEDGDLVRKCKVVEKIRHLLKDDEEARIYVGANGFLEALLRFLEHAISVGDQTAQETGAMALFNLAVNNNRNKESMLALGVLPLLHKMSSNADSAGAATALYLNLSCLDEAKAIIGNSVAVPFLISVLRNENEEQCKLDALHTLYNISSEPANIPHLLTAGIIEALQAVIGHPWTEKCIAILIYLASSKNARDEIRAVPSLINALATVLDVGEPVEQEQTAACLLMLCSLDEKCTEMVLQEGVIPSLVSISVNGTVRGKHKAQKLLMLFREQRQRHKEREPSPLPTEPVSQRPLSKTVSRHKVGKALSFWRKNKSFSVYHQC